MEGVTKAVALIAISLNAQAAAGICKALFWHAAVLLVLATGCWLKVRPRYTSVLACLALSTLVVTGLLKTGGVGSLEGSNAITSRIFAFVGLALVFAEIVVGGWIWHSRRMWRLSPPITGPKTYVSRRAMLIWAGSVVTVCLAYALTILVILPRFFPKLDPGSARMLEFQRQQKA